MLADSIQIVQKLTANEIAARLETIADEERTLRVLLRSVRARERAARQRAKPVRQPGKGAHRVR